MFCGFRWIFIWDDYDFDGNSGGFIWSDFAGFIWWDFGGLMFCGFI